MMMETKNSVGTNAVMVKGEVSRMPAWAPVRVFMAITGLMLIQSVLRLIARYLLALKGLATATVEGEHIVLTTEWSIMGRRIRIVKTTALLRHMDAVRFENRQRYLHLLVGFGALVVGTLVGMQWFLDGLRAGYPYLVLLGAAVVGAGVIADIALYLLVPRGPGRNHLVFALGPWTTRLIGVDSSSAKKFLETLESNWRR